MSSRGDTSPTISGASPTLSRHEGKVLILGGTAEGRELATLLERAGYAPVTSLAGGTQKPAQMAGETRRGGFGGAEGLLHYLARERFTALVDATHPFATAISRQAKEAAEARGLPLVRLERPAWQPEPGDRWINVPDIPAAVKAIPTGAQILLTIGRKEAAPFLARSDISGIARMIEPMDIEVTGNWRIMLARPPFHVEKELCLLSEHSISHLVTKNSGGEETRAKLIAARMKGIKVIMIARPAKPQVAIVSDPLAALAFVGKVVSA
jgi:precorrin-6A/cobalt-precorrin-6A reductase